MLRAERLFKISHHLGVDRAVDHRYDQFVGLSLVVQRG